MSVDIMQTISIVAFGLAGIFALVALILWFTLGVRGIIDDLSGRKAERQIRELREQNVQSQMADRKNRVVYAPASGKIASKPKIGRENERTSQLTAPLAAYKAETTLLQEESMTVLNTEEGTTVLGAEEGTTVLSTEKVTLQNGYGFVLNEIVVHTKEEIRIV